jgi:dTDP-4-amino-4,6-dideoxygalactose transaminase
MSTSKKECKVNFINASYRRFYQNHKDEILSAIESCLERGDFIMREDLDKFEKNLCDYTGAKYAVGVNSGTDALGLSHEALGIGRGDEVICVSHTFIAPFQETVHKGGIPILIDVNEDDCLMNVSQIEPAITEKTKAILPVHLSGAVCNMKEIMRIANKYNLKVIEDACQALGSVQDGKMAGTFGDTGTYSFISPKLLGVYGDAGAVVTNNKEIYEKLLLLRNHWNITQNALLGVQLPHPEIMSWGHNTRMDNIQAAVLNVKIKYIDWIIKRRKEIAERYLFGLKDLSIILPMRREGETWQEFIVRPKDREAFKNFIEEKGVELLIRDTTPNHKLKGLGLEHFNLPITEKLATEQARLPIYPELTNEEVDYVIDCVKEFYD